jgi:hypothetical protein
MDDDNTYTDDDLTWDDAHGIMDDDLTWDDAHRITDDLTWDDAQSDCGGIHHPPLANISSSKDPARGRTFVTCVHHFFDARLGLPASF